MKNIDVIFEEFKSTNSTAKGRKPDRRMIQYLEVFIKFLKDFPAALGNKSFLSDYKYRIFNLKNRNGFCFSPAWMRENIVHARLYLNWCESRGYIEKNPIKIIHLEAIERELEDRWNDRRLALLRQNAFVPDEQIMQAFIEHCRSNYDYRHKSRIEELFKRLKPYLQSSGKGVKDLREADLFTMIEIWAKEEMHPSIRIADYTLSHRIFAFKTFMRWIYETGYTDHFDFEAWTEARILKEIKAIKEKIKGEKKLKTRNYSVKEILRAYQKYLKKTYENYGDIRDLYNGVKQFIRYLAANGKTLYTADAGNAEAYKKYLFEHEYSPGRYYTAYYQADLIRHVKRFYDWFENERYRTDNIFKGFMMHTYIKEISGRLAARKVSEIKVDTVSKCFEEIYRGILIFEKNNNLSLGTRRGHDRGFRLFFHYLEHVGIEDIRIVDERVLNDYQAYVHNLKGKALKTLSLHSRSRFLIAVKKLYSYLAMFRYLDRDPSLCIRLPKCGRGLPTTGMNDREMRLVLTSKDIADVKSIRDRAILETLYSCGIRANELRNIRLDDIDMIAGLIRVNVPKGGINYQRIIPIGKTACEWIERYKSEVRKHLPVIGSDCLFLSERGNQMSTVLILNIVKTWHLKSGLRKKIVTHSFRVSCATEMLKGKADIKFVQQQLGHTSIQSTERYLRLVPGDLKKIHSKTHPRDRREQQK